MLGVQQYQAQAIPADRLPIAPPKEVRSAKDTLVVASLEPDSLLPIASDAPGTVIIAGALFSGLVNRDARDDLYPEVAWYVPTLENGGAYFAGAGDDLHLVVKYKLRPGVKWSDGEEITSNDAIFYYRLVMDARTPVITRRLQEELYNIDNPDKYTVICNFMSYAQARDFYNAVASKKNYPLASDYAFLKGFIDAQRPVVDPQYSTVGGLLPEHVLGKIPPDKLGDSAYNRNPVGNGPFKVESWTSGEELVLVANPNYNLTEPPLLKRIVFKFIYDVKQTVAQLKGGSLDAATSALFIPPAADLKQLGPDLKVEYTPSHTWERMAFNLDRPIFQDKAVRQAMAYAINRQGLVDQFFQGNALVLNTFLPPISWASMQNPDFAKDWQSKFPLKQYNYDPARANKMLDDAGWLVGPDGVRAKDGVKLSFEYAGLASRVRAQFMPLIVANLKAIGIATTPRLFSNAWCTVGDCYTGYFAQRRFDVFEVPSVLGVEPSGSLYDSQQIPYITSDGGGQNIPSYKNPRLDQLSRTADMEAARASRAPLLAEMQSIWSEDLPDIPLYVRPNIEVHRTNLVNWEPSSGTAYFIYKAATLYFK